MGGKLSKCKSLFIIFCLVFATFSFAEDLPPDFKAHLEKNDSEHFFSQFINMLMTLGLIVSIILIAAFFIKKLLHAQIDSVNSKSAIKIIDRLSISTKSTVYILDIQGEKFIVGESINGLTNLKLNRLDKTI